jgi:hypothetical protein
MRRFEAGQRNYHNTLIPTLASRLDWKIWRHRPIGQQNISGSLFLFAFDLLEVDDEDYRNRPIEMRKRALAGLTANAPPDIR